MLAYFPSQVANCILHLLVWATVLCGKSKADVFTYGHWCGKPGVAEQEQLAAVCGSHCLSWLGKSQLGSYHILGNVTKSLQRLRDKTCLLWATTLHGRSEAYVFLPPDKDYLISQSQA